MGAILESAGLVSTRLSKRRFLDDMDDFAAFNNVYAHSFGDHLPARSAVAVERLPKGALVEVEFIAKVGE
ncbi:MAG: Rid family hydrolase [Slackia sp.]